MQIFSALHEKALRISPGFDSNSAVRTIGLWFIRGSIHTLYKVPVAPAFVSDAPNTKVWTRALMSAPAHMTQGSSVTTRSQPSRRQRPRCWAASRRANTSACAVGSLVASCS